MYIELDVSVVVRRIALSWIRVWLISGHRILTTLRNILLSEMGVLRVESYSVLFPTHPRYADLVRVAQIIRQGQIKLVVIYDE